ncbi:MAG: hypothetical protein IRZ16_14785 [Myxococcaceae bacterium]|nr:hypothetical protein [Myxococcaceae bacterium]
MHLPTLLSTVILDPPTALLFGLAFALISARLIAKDPERETSRTALIGGGWGVLYGLSVGWCFFAFPDWMLVYLKDAREVTLPIAYVVFVALCALFGVVGALANAHLLRHGRRGLAWLLTIGAVVTLACIFWLQSKQYALVGTFEAYYAGKAVPLTESKDLQRAMNVSAFTATPTALALFIWRYWLSRRK